MRDFEVAIEYFLVLTSILDSELVVFDISVLVFDNLLDVSKSSCPFRVCIVRLNTASISIACRVFSSSVPVVFGVVLAGK